MTDLRLVLAVVEETFGNAPERVEWPKSEGILLLLQRANDTLAELHAIEKRMRRTTRIKASKLEDSEDVLEVEDLQRKDLEEGQGIRVSRRAWLMEQKNIEALLLRLRETRHNLATALTALTAARM